MVPASRSMLREPRARLRADVEDHLVGPHLVGAPHGRRRIGRELACATTTSTGSGNVGAALGHRREDLAALGHQIRLGQRLADRLPRASRKVLAMPPPTISWSTLRARLSRIVSLVETLRAGHDRRPAAGADCRARATARRSRRRAAGRRRPGGEPGDAVGRRFRAMRGAEGVVDVDVAQRGQLARELVAVLLLALVDAAVLEQHHLAGLHRHAVDPIGAQRHRRPSSAARRAATGAEESSGLSSPSVGRPRCEVTMTAAPAASAISIAGTEARMRVSSVMRPGRRAER